MPVGHVLHGTRPDKFVEHHYRLQRLDMAQPFAAFRDEELRTWVASHGSNPGPFQDRGSDIHRLVEVMGFEPTASTLRT